MVKDCFFKFCLRCLSFEVKSFGGRQFSVFSLLDFVIVVMSFWCVILFNLFCRIVWFRDKKLYVFIRVDFFVLYYLKFWDFYLVERVGCVCDVFNVIF